MVLGFGEGKIDIQIEKTNFSPGETIRGKVRLELKKSKKARQVRIKLVAEEKRRRQTRSAMGTMDSVRNLYVRELKLDEEKEYPIGEAEYDFEFDVPANVIPEKPQGMLGQVIGAAQFIGMAPRYYWYLDAALDIPMGIDVSKRVQISVK